MFAKSLLSFIFLFTPALEAAPHAPWPKEAQKAALEIKGQDLLSTIRVLASDEFEGRSPGTAGEEATVKYLTSEFQRLGLKPGNPDGTYVQKVPLVGSVAEYHADIEVKGKHEDLTPNGDFVAVSHRQVPNVEIKGSDLVFVGYGVVAPEYHWDDYKDVDVRGKILVMLVNDPQVPDPKNPAQLDEQMFKGKAMTYYGRWTYKYEIAALKGAAGAIIIHETGMAGYPFEVVIESWGRENFTTASVDKNNGRVAVEAWITDEKARQILAGCGQNLDALKKAALSRDFRPVNLAAKLNLTIKRTEREVLSQNVVGKIEGSDPHMRGRYVVYTAHWDHFGRDPKRAGDQIFHGAIDNASGVAALLETAKAFRTLKVAPKSSILFIATTAEERGLLGAKYYADHPLYPLGRTLADINYDGINQWGRTKDLQLVGRGATDLEDQLGAMLTTSGRVLVPEDKPERGMYYRTDLFELSKVGVPSIGYHKGNDYVGKPATFGAEKGEQYVAHDYHKVSDVIKPDWDLRGAEEDIRVFFRLGYQIAQSPQWPEWKPGAEFSAKRAESAKMRQ